MGAHEGEGAAAMDGRLLPGLTCGCVVLLEDPAGAGGGDGLVWAQEVAMPARISVAKNCLGIAELLL